MLINLTSNARKYVPKNGGLIKFNATLVKEGKNFQLQVTVADNGDSISPEDQKKLFKPFSKLNDAKNLNPSGNGLGLSICKNICNNLGGDITVRSQPGDMTNFTFWVNVKIPDDCDISGVMSPRVSAVKALPEGHTKDAVGLSKNGQGRI